MSQPLTPEQQFLLGGGGAPGAFTKFDPPGTRRGGQIVERPELRQQTEYKTNEPLAWPDGNPRMQLIVTVATDQRDPAREDDDGHRRFYVKGDLQRAVREALKTSGATGLEAGGSLFVTRVRQEGEYDAWVHAAEYTPAATNFVTNGDSNGNAEPASNGHPHHDGEDPALTEALAKLPAEQAAAFRAAGLDLTGLRAMGLQV